MNSYLRNVIWVVIICGIIGFGYYSYYDQKIDQNVKIGVTESYRGEQQRAVIKEGVTYITLGGIVIISVVTLIITAISKKKD
jgi:hypothetical protein